MSDKENPLQGWIPYRLVVENEKALAKWMYTAKVPFTEPFFDESLMAIRSQDRAPSRFHSVSSLESMTGWAERFPYTPPRAVIFHVSRCGSTLLSQLLSLTDKHCVLSEVPFFDELLRSAPKSNLLLQDVVKAAYSFITQPRTGKEENIFIKADSWHIFFAGLYRKLFPDATFILLYRSPDEVLRSHQKMRGMHAVQGIIEPGLFGFDVEKIAAISPDEYASLVFEKYLTAFEELAAKDKNTLLLNYNEGMECIMDKIAERLGMKWEDEYHTQMRERLKFHSKNPGQKFEEAKIRERSPSFLEPAMRAYNRLASAVAV